jgi:membrane protein DedA with SNARE-associated domain
MPMLEYFQDLLNSISPMTAYLALGISAFLENVVPPVPGDTVVVFGAYLVSTGRLDFWGVYISTTLGSVIGFIAMYLAGWRFGRAFIQNRRLREKIFKVDDIKKVEIWFGKWGYWVIFANRFLSGTRSVISLFAGSFHLHPLPVIALSLASALIWNALLITAGMLLGDNWEIIINIISRYNQVFVLLIIIFVIYFIYRRRKKSKNTP